MSDPLVRQSCMNFVFGQTRDADDFGAGAGALDDGQTGRGEIKQLGEKGKTGVVGLPLDRRRRQSDLERLTDEARHFITGGQAGLDADGQCGLRLGGRLTGHRRYS